MCEMSDRNLMPQISRRVLAPLVEHLGLFLHMDEEIWKDILGYEGMYQISNFGRVKSLRYHRSKKQKVLKPNLTGEYAYVNLSINNHYHSVKIHRAVATAFIPNPNNKPFVNHKDGNKFNNMVENLEWVTAAENVAHAKYVLGINIMKGRSFGGSHFSKEIEQYLVGKDGVEYLLATYTSIMSAAFVNGINPNSIRQCLSGRIGESHGYIWKYKIK